MGGSKWGRVCNVRPETKNVVFFWIGSKAGAVKKKRTYAGLGGKRRGGAGEGGWA